MERNIELYDQIHRIAAREKILQNLLTNPNIPKTEPQALANASISLEMVGRAIYDQPLITVTDLMEQIEAGSIGLRADKDSATIIKIHLAMAASALTENEELFVMVMEAIEDGDAMYMNMN